MESIHSIIAEDRRRISLSGVSDVERFDENSVILYTSAGKLTVKGKMLTVSELNTENGEMTIGGEVDSFVYGDRSDNSKKSLFSKLFR